jgi:hypothetical protein
MAVFLIRWYWYMWFVFLCCLTYAANAGPGEINTCSTKEVPDFILIGPDPGF